MSVGNGSILSALVRPVPVEEFLGSYWPERVFHSHGALSRLPALFSSPELLSFRALASRYQGWMGFGRGATGGRMISVQQVNPVHLYEMGLSIYLPDISPNVPGAEAFLRQLEADLGVATGSCHITVWASPKEDGAATHFDCEDVFSIQLTGTKRFEVAPMKDYAFPVGTQFGPDAQPYDEMYAQIENGFPEAVEAEFRLVDMKPGSVLFVPRGTWHRTTAEQDSFAISIGIRPPTVMDSFLEQLRFVLLQDPEWRRPLYGAYGSGVQRRQALERAQKVLTTAAEMTRAVTSTDLAPPPEAEQLRNVERTTRFQREIRTRIAFEPGNGAEILHVKAWSLEAGERDTLTLNVPPQFSTVFRWLAESRSAFSAGELAAKFPEIPFEQVQKILDVLTRARYLRLLWFPPSPSR
jgi:hypothetical protein